MPRCCCLAEPSDESSEDEPLINLVKKNSTNKQTKNKRKASSPKKRSTTPKKPKQDAPSAETGPLPELKTFLNIRSEDPGRPVGADAVILSWCVDLPQHFDIVNVGRVFDKISKLLKRHSSSLLVEGGTFCSVRTFQLHLTLQIK